MDGLENTFHRRDLKAPAVAFSSPEGRQLFRDALQEGNMENYFFLSEQYTTQAHPAFCGIGSLTMALNALLVDPRRKWQGVWRWYDDEMLNCCDLLETVKEKGITLSQLACVASWNGVETTIMYGTSMTLDEFREVVSTSCSRIEEDKTVLIASYSRKVLNQTGSGHFSPVGGYNREKDMVLIMDVARFKYPPHWVPLACLYDALQPIDPDSGKPRGLLQVVASKDGDLQSRLLCNCLNENDKEHFEASPCRSLCRKPE